MGTFPVVFKPNNTRKSYVGGKKIDNSGGNIVDFIYKNEITNNIAIIEIKTPKTKLIGPNYRNNAYCIHQDLIGGISQVLAYKTEIEKSYYQLFVQEHLKLFNPKCILIAGNLEGEAPNETQLCSFELFRHNLTNVEVITYDELFAKLQLLLDLLQAN